MNYSLPIVFALCIAIAVIGRNKTPSWLRVLCAIGAIWLTWYETGQIMVRELDGRMNRYVGLPYRDLISHLDELAQRDQFEELGNAISTLKSNTTQLSEVWLANDFDAFSRFVTKITETNSIASNTP